MKIELMTYFKRRDAKFDSAYAPPPREVFSLGTILIGAAAVIIGLGISAIGMHKYSQNARLGVLNAERLAAVALSEGEQFRRPDDSSQMAENEAFVISQSTISEISDLINPQSRSVGKNVVRNLHDVPSNRSVLVEPMREEQAALQETEFLDSAVVAAPEQTENQHLNNPLLITDLTAIALGSGLPFREEIVAKESPLLPETSPAKNQIETMDETAWRVQLISLNSESNAEAAWTRLQQTNPDLLNNLSVQIQPAELSKGTFYRVQVGPLVEREAADSLCEALKSRNQDCLIIAP